MVYSPDSTLSGLGYADESHTYGQLYTSNSSTDTIAFTENDVPDKVKLCAYNGENVYPDDGSSEDDDGEDGEDDNANYDIKRLNIKNSVENYAGWFSEACGNDSFSKISSRLVGFGVKLGDCSSTYTASYQSIRAIAPIIDTHSCETIG